MKRLFRFLKRTGLGHVPGLLALYNFLYGSFIRFYKVNGVVNIDGQKIVISLDDLSTSRRLLVYGEHVKETADFLKNTVKEGMVVADIGANIGYYTLLAAKRVGTKGRVYAFEPDPRCVEILRKNISLNNHANVVILPKAVSSTGGGTIPVYLDKHNFSLTSLAKENVTTTEDKIDVQTIALDDFFEKFIGDSRLDFIKMNIQGAEDFAIEGASKLLRKNNVIMITEFWPEGLIQCGSNPAHMLMTLKNLGYQWRPTLDQSGKHYSIDETIRLGNEFIDKRKMSLHLVVAKS